MAKPSARSGKKRETKAQREEREQQEARDATRRRIVCDAIQVGARLDEALAFAEVDQDEHEAWLELEEYAKELRQAEATFTINQLSTINREAGKGDWRAAERLLRMRYPERFATQAPAGGDPGPQSSERANCSNCGAVLSADAGGDTCRLCSNRAGGLTVVEGGRR